MDIYKSDNDQVIKAIHQDASETCIKTVHSVDIHQNHKTGKLTPTSVDRNKYSVFISSSAGCPQSCTFCYLTIDKMPFKTILQHKVINNVKDLIVHEAESGIRDKFIKVCWMGMGEPILQHNSLVHSGTLALLDWTFDNDLTMGLDGVDISTIIPRNLGDWVTSFHRLNCDLRHFPLNPNNGSVVNKEQGNLIKYTDRSRFRLFYSLHSAIQETRDKIIPRAAPIRKAIPQLLDLQLRGVNVIIHHMFLEGINDTEEEVTALIQLMERHFPNSELRILRYNKHEESTVRESDMVEKCICMLYGSSLKKIKVQVSYGLEVKSACGQFIYNKTDSVSHLQTQ